MQLISDINFISGQIHEGGNSGRNNEGTQKSTQTAKKKVDFLCVLWYPNKAVRHETTISNTRNQLKMLEKSVDKSENVWYSIKHPPESGVYLVN